MKIDIKEFAGKIKPIRETDVYSVHDLEYLKTMNVSMTILHPGKETMGHEHDDSDEVVIVVDGKGRFQLDERRFDIETGDIMLVKAGQFHKTFNPTGEDLVILCVFNKYEGRGKKVKQEPDSEKVREEEMEELEKMGES
jgi:mannose-6-phosphate isomerase-like protein (cupin superfamily)